MWKFAVDFLARGLHTRTAVARLPLRQLDFLVYESNTKSYKDADKKAAAWTAVTAELKSPVDAILIFTKLTTTTVQ